MHRLPTVLLHHLHPAQPHYDWLLAVDGDGPLWTARVAWPSGRWRGRGRLDLVPLGMHRRQYLTYQGPLTGDRGEVRRVDAGWHSPRLWSRSRIVTRVHLTRCHALVDMRRLHADRWIARVTGLASAA